MKTRETITMRNETTRFEITLAIVNFESFIVIRRSGCLVREFPTDMPVPASRALFQELANGLGAH